MPVLDTTKAKQKWKKRQRQSRHMITDRDTLEGERNLTKENQQSEEKNDAKRESLAEKHRRA